MMCTIISTPVSGLLPMMEPDHRHASLTPIQVVDPGQSAMADRSNPVVAQMDECIV
jgi:hypothetical protein